VPRPSNLGFCSVYGFRCQCCSHESTLKYSRGIRQGAHKEGNWRVKYNMLIGTGKEVPADYSELLSKSIFCLVMPGGWVGDCVDGLMDGWSDYLALVGLIAWFDRMGGWVGGRVLTWLPSSLSLLSLQLLSL
jgi:hypothetical protein